MESIRTVLEEKAATLAPACPRQGGVHKPLRKDYGLPRLAFHPCHTPVDLRGPGWPAPGHMACAQRRGSIGTYASARQMRPSDATEATITGSNWKQLVHDRDVVQRRTSVKTILHNATGCPPRQASMGVVPIRCGREVACLVG
jgi:hypothetical protein